MTGMDDGVREDIKVLMFARGCTSFEEADWLFELRLYVHLTQKRVISETFFPANFSTFTEKLKLTQQKQTRIRIVT